MLSELSVPEQCGAAGGSHTGDYEGKAQITRQEPSTQAQNPPNVVTGETHSV